MFPQLPEEIEYKIWKIYHNMYVLKEIKESPSIWRNSPPSEDLFKNSSDYGAIQFNHTDFERLFDSWYETYHTFLFRIILGKNYYECCGACYVQKPSKPCKQIDYEEVFENKSKGYWDLSYYDNHLTLEEINHLTLEEINGGNRLYWPENEEDLQIDLFR